MPRAPKDKELTYIVVIIVAAIIVFAVIGAIIGAVTAAFFLRAYVFT